MNLVNLFWEKDDILLQSQILFCGIMNATYLGTSVEFLYFVTQIAWFVVISEKLLLFETQIATFVGISKKLLLFYWKCYISWEIYKFATFSIKVKFFNQFLWLLFTGKQWVYCEIRIDNAAVISFSVIIFFPCNAMVSPITIIIYKCIGFWLVYTMFQIIFLHVL